MTNTALIAVDWGTSSFRAWRLASDGRAIDDTGLPLGIMKVEGGAFGGTLETAIGPWRRESPDAPVLMSGMIGSRQGWHEAAYVACPTSLDQLAGRLAPVPGAPGVWIVPGLSFEPSGEAPEVMRGEETQLLGLDTDVPGIAILPGTHSKWVHLGKGRIEAFATFMTGEVYDVLVHHSILGRLMDLKAAGNADSATSFHRGAEAARSGEGAGLLNQLFGARTHGLFGNMSGAALPHYLSGLLIGTEVRDGLALASRWGIAPSNITIVGTHHLAALYRAALDLFGIATNDARPDAAVRGLLRIARAARLIKDTA